MVRRNSVIIDGNVVEVAKNGKEVVIRNENKHGCSYLNCTIPKKRLRDSLARQLRDSFGDMRGKDIVIVGTVTGTGIVVDYAEYKPKEVIE